MSVPSPSKTGPDTRETEVSASRASRRFVLPSAFGPADHPTTIDRFRILGPLGIGGMGIVYEAYDPTLDRHVAIKVVHRRLSEREDKRLHREAQGLARLSHPNVVQVFEVGRCPQGTYLVMERVRGRSLRQWLATGARSPAEILAMFVQAGEGLAAAHAAGMVHRDFKPGNVLVGEDGRARVLDFGLARAGRAGTVTDEGDALEPLASPRGNLEGDGEAGPLVAALRPAPDDAATLRTMRTTAAAAAPVPTTAPVLDHDSLGEDLVAARLTDHDTVLGTPAYMAPEQHLSQPLTPAADQFGFCVALYEALFHAHPFGEHEDRLLRTLTGDVEPPPDSSVPEAVCAAILRGLSTKPDDRFPSMPALLHALRPRPRRPWLAPVAGLLVAAAVTVVAGALATSAGPDPCAHGPTQLAAAWSDRQGEVQAALLATGLPYAADTWQRTAARLDDYAETWLSAHARTCEASLRGALPPAEHDARMRCLDEHRRALTALVDALASAEPSTVRHAVAAAGQLPPLAECDDPEVLDRIGAALAADATAEAPHDAHLRQRVATLRAYDLTGDHARGLALAAELRPRVIESDDAMLRAELELHEGVLHVRAGDPAAATEHLETAYFLAKELAHDRVALEAAMRLVFVAHAIQHDAEQAEAWLEHAAAELPRAGTPSLRASFEGLRGLVAEGAQRSAEAVEHHTRAVELYTAIRGPDDPAVARSLANLANALAWEGRSDDAIAALRRAIAIDEQQLGPRHPELAQHVHNLGVFLHDRGDPAAGLEQLERALALREQILEPDHLDIATSLELIGRVHLEQGRFSDARRVIEQALAIRTRKQGPEHIHVAFTLGALGELQLMQGDAAAAEQTLRRTVEIADTATPGHPFGPHTRTWLGEALTMQGRWDEGIAELQEALAQLEAQRGPDDAMLMGPLQALAGAALERGQPAQALAFATRALALGERTQHGAPRLARARWLLAQALWETGGDRTRARALAKLAAQAWQDQPGKAGHLAAVRRWLADHRP